ncbi:hypothetical protein QYE76_011970 [Lolium multiflorum]|uniref:Myb-like domain-containing protein n=1 Tax=Lolium multiflorum TaxID=4521 RepID=A0AAD8TZW2_LOLMU|nr:hypothetical protein QYE76_011970 [Lolium multiflorum]
MQQHQQGGGGGGPPQQFGLHPPEMPPFSPPGTAGQQRISMPEGPSPISSRPPAPAPAPAPVQQHQQSSELGAVGFDEEALAAAAAGEEGASGGAGGNRWPRQETLALLKIRSDMDAAFRDATLKGPLWEEVSRKLAEEGYRRNAKKCKEKFENVHKYYKRTKDSRAGRNDGKTYRFFQQLEALHGTPGAAPSPAAPPAATAVGVPGVVGPSAVRPLAEPPPPPVGGTAAGLAAPMLPGNLSFSTSNTEDYSDEGDSDDEGTDDMAELGKRKRTPDGGAAAGAGSGKMMRFFEGLMKQVMERQEVMQQRFLDAIEKREQDRMIREEAWRRQEMARLAREQEILAQERAMAATRDAAVLSFIQKITGQTIPMPSIAAPAITFMPPPPPSLQNHVTPIAFSVAPPPSSQPPSSTHAQRQPSPRPQKLPTMPPTAPQPQKSPAPVTPQPPKQQALVVHQSSTDIVMASAETPPDASGYDGSGGGSGAASSSRWPKAEVHALIQLRSNLDMRYQEAGPKGPLWEEISAGMRQMGYSRSSKRCKEKWENINKYFKKVKESNKKRPEDSKTCPYFHQLEALYRNKAALGSPSGAGGAPPLPPPAVEHTNAAPKERIESFTVAAPISQTAPQPHSTQLPPVAKTGVSNNDGNGHGVGGVSVGTQMQASNGGSVAGNRFVFSEAGGRAATKKAEDIMKETTTTPQLQPQPQVAQQATINSYSRTAGGGAADSDNMDEDDEDEEDYDDDEEDEDDLDGNKMQYEMFQRQQEHQHHQHQHHNVVRPNAGATSGGGNPPGATAPSAAAATTTAGSFLGMVQ